MTRAPFQSFELEHYQSLYEHEVEFNLADSSVKCLGTREWLTPDEQAALLDTGLFYPQVNGTLDLRQRIAALYTDADAANVLVTVGASQANSMVCATLLQPGDEVVVMSPGYRQVWGHAKNIGCVVKELPLDPARGWRPDLDMLDRLVTSRTRLVAIVNPNNPTGTILSSEEGDRVIAACARVGAWLHVDEVYGGTEIDGFGETPSFWGRYDRLICTNSLSKAYGLSGLRIGWAITDRQTIEDLWRRHEYAVIAAAAPSMTLASIALQPAKRRFLLERQRNLSSAGRQVLASWLRDQGNVFSVLPSPATSLGFVRFDLPMTSFELAEAIRTKANVLVAPGSFLGAEQHLRITLGYEPEKVAKALDRIGAVAAEIRRA
ncbi:aminotransferase class I/II-fold pyridoxal phosphate-dependent enzyme [Dongia soli]|uniref:Aminotransferase n=1 Tax=Dongia soli TaxID=600628 RepID=A0ABU5E906_9PROT|nr:aminotransferase class I/II-fold pyridoxal phosphate-dependent enzyme [Dongia soli]MDY0882808.1 aminotransferase class I/II-fold pyridoxal phosphate-dependent enzyme [Dongia soli]